MKLSNIKLMSSIVALGFSLSVVGANAHQHKHVNVKRDYKVIVLYTSPDPLVHKAVARKIIAAKKRKAHIIRRTIKAALR